MEEDYLERGAQAEESPLVVGPQCCSHIQSQDGRPPLPRCAAIERKNWSVSAVSDQSSSPFSAPLLPTQPS